METQTSNQFWRSTLLRLFGYALLLFLVAKVIELDMIQQSVKENSFTERMQESFLLLTTILLGYIAYKFLKFKAFAIMFGAFTLVSLIREMDAFLENNLFDKAWQVLALAVLLPSLFFLYKNAKKFYNNLQELSNSLSFGLILISMLILHVFSRLYGRKVIWKALMGKDKFIRAVKDASEEGIELLAYSILFIGVIELYRFVKQNNTLV